MTNMTSRVIEAIKNVTTEVNDLDRAKVGDGATINCYSDRQACTIVKRTDKKIWVQRDKATLLNGLKSGEPDALHFAPGGFCGHTSGTQRWAYTPNADEAIVCYSRREVVYSDGSLHIKYVRVGEAVRNGQTISTGRHEHYDYNF